PGRHLRGRAVAARREARPLRDAAHGARSPSRAGLSMHARRHRRCSRSRPRVRGSSDQRTAWRRSRENRSPRGHARVRPWRTEILSTGVGDASVWATRLRMLDARSSGAAEPKPAIGVDAISSSALEAGYGTSTRDRRPKPLLEARGEEIFGVL